MSIGNFRLASLALSVVLLLITSSGCAPIFPTFSSDIKDGDLRGDVSDLPNSLKYASETRQELENALANTTNFKRGVVYTLFGIGTGVGGVIAFDASKTVIESLALTTATVLGLNEAVSPTKQMAIYEAGLDAIDCAVDAAQALAQTASQFGADFRVTPRLSVTVGSIMATSSVISARHFATATATTDTTVTTEEGRRRAVEERSDAVTAFSLRSVAATNAINLVNATNSTIVAAEQTKDAATAAGGTAASMLRGAVRDIKKEVIKQLAATIPDPNAIAQAQRQRVFDAIAELKKARDDLKAAKKKLDEQPQPTPVQPPAPGQPPAPAGTGLGLSLEDILGAQAATQINATSAFAVTVLTETAPIETVFKECVDRLTSSTS